LHGKPAKKAVHTMTNRRIIFVILATSLTTAICVGALAKSVKRPRPSLPNFHKVTDGIYRGAAPSKDGLKSLKKMNIHTIIDLRNSSKQAKTEKQTAEAMGFKWINIPMGKAAPTQKQVDLFLNTLAKAPTQPVFVHCQYGADRTGCMIGIYRVKIQKWSFAKTWPEMRKYGFKPYLCKLKNAVKSRAKKL
jgi:protein tyrosine/serine phosphatase